MNIVCQKNVLANYINIVSKAVSNKTTIPILECILLKANNNQFTLTANNLEIGIETSAISCEVTEDGEIALDARLFFDIIRKLPDGSVSIKTDENLLTTINCLKSEYKILGQNAEDFPLLPEVTKNQEYIINQFNFRDLIKLTNFSVSFDESKPIFTGELLEINENKISLVSIDGFRISYAKSNFSENNVNASVVIPGKTINEIGKLISGNEDDNLSLYISENYVLFSFDDFRIVSRVLEGEFLKYEQSFSSDYTSKVNLNRTQLLDAIERVSVLSKDGKKNPVRLILNNNVMELKSKTELGTAFEEISIQLEGKNIEIGFNPKYLTDPLKVIEDEDVTLLFNTAISPCIMYNENNDNYKYLILPLKL